MLWNPFDHMWMNTWLVAPTQSLYWISCQSLLWRSVLPEIVAGHMAILEWKLHICNTDYLPPSPLITSNNNVRLISSFKHMVITDGWLKSLSPTQNDMLSQQMPLLHTGQYGATWYETIEKWHHLSVPSIHLCTLIGADLVSFSPLKIWHTVWFIGRIWYKIIIINFYSSELQKSRIMKHDKIFT